MIYLLTEKVMNGTVTMDIIATGIEAESFDAAFEKLTHFENWHTATNIQKDDKQIGYTICPAIAGGFGIYGSMKKESLKIM